MTVLTGAALKRAILAKVGKSCEPHMCLMETRRVANIAAKWGSAISAWNHSVHRHPGQRPPSGAVVPLYFDTDSVYEHVDWGTGDGRVVTINGSHWTMYSSISAMEQAWHCKYIGWAEDLNGEKLYTPPPPPPKPKYRDCRPLQRVLRATPDNEWGPDSSKRLNAVRQASNWKHNRFPWGKKYTQGVVGTAKDGNWGPKSAAAHTATVKAIQRIVGVKVDGIYGPATDKAVIKFLSTAHKV